LNYFDEPGVENKQSKILTEKLYRSLLYFNLPYETIIERNIKPTRMFKWESGQEFEFKGKGGGEEYTIGKLIENFEKGAAALGGGSNHKVLIPNIILMSVPIKSID
jgi:hypothetical protein